MNRTCGGDEERVHRSALPLDAAFALSESGGPMIERPTVDDGNRSRPALPFLRMG